MKSLEIKYMYDFISLFEILTETMILEFIIMDLHVCENMKNSSKQ